MGAYRVLPAAVLTVLAALPSVGFAVGPASAGPVAVARGNEIVLPTSDAAQLAATELLRRLPGFRPDRLLPSNVPGPVINDELVQVGLAEDGAVAAVVLDQRLRLTGTGDYAVRERGPARSATSLNGERAPLTQRGAVVWQGFSPGSRDLAARLVLDPAIEASHLPLEVTITFAGRNGTVQALQPGGRVPSAGTVEVTIRNVTSQPATLPTGRDVAPAAVAPLLDTALRIATSPSAARLPTSGRGLPMRLQVAGAARTPATQSTPFHLSGSLVLQGTPGIVTGPASTPIPNGVEFTGVLPGDGSVVFRAQASRAGTVDLDLTAVAALDPRTLRPPRGLASWAQWARSAPPLVERHDALLLTVEVAASTARASSYSPYLGAGLIGSGSTSFHYAFAPAPEQRALAAPPEPQWGAIALSSFAVLLLLGAAEGVRRQL